jgi:adenylate cyclase
MGTEIERKFLVAAIPSPEELGPGVRLRQGYLALDDQVEVRMRSAGDATLLTIKAGRGLTRTEVELPLDGASADVLWPHAAARSLEKVRHRIDLDAGLTAELDLYEDALAGLATVEVELPSEEAAAWFTPPPWFGREVTGEPGWSNADLASHGPPATR